MRRGGAPTPRERGGLWGSSRHRKQHPKEVPAFQSTEHMPPASEVAGKGSCILCFTLGAGFLKQGPPVHSGRSVSLLSFRS